MIKLPINIEQEFNSLLIKHSLASNVHFLYKKWLRYYWDFCNKYHHDAFQADSLLLFVEKLQQKRQTVVQQKQAKLAITLFYQLGKGAKSYVVPAHSVLQIHESDRYNSYHSRIPDPVRETKGNILSKPSLQAQALSHSEIKQTQVQEAKTGSSWVFVFEQLKNEIKLRHYSPKTLKAYRGWVVQFQTFTKSKDYLLLSQQDVVDFLTFLAVKKQVSASSQNQAFNALLFLFKQVLRRDFGEIKGVVRAKRKTYIPVVLSRAEVDLLLDYLFAPADLVAKLLYGCGLRLGECLNLRVQDFNFDMGILTVHDGKGKKDRTVPIPQSIVAELQKQLQKVSTVYKQDVDAKFAGTFLPDQLNKKYINAATEYIWQWFFPAQSLTYLSDKQEYRRYHVHESVVQKAIKKASQDACLTKRATAHTLRHSFASHLLEANYDIRTIQELLGHSDVRTTMIYTHTLKSRTLKEAKSPLDFGLVDE